MKCATENSYEARYLLSPSPHGTEDVGKTKSDRSVSKNNFKGLFQVRGGIKLSSLNRTSRTMGVLRGHHFVATELRRTQCFVKLSQMDRVVAMEGVGM